MSQVPTENETLLLKQPTLSAEYIGFLYAGDIWVIERDGGTQSVPHLPRRLTAQKGAKFNPVFSPDGQWIAFSGNYDGNLSVYVISKDGGSPKRLTYHPGDDLVRGWTPDGKNILFASARASITARAKRLFIIPVEGGFPTALPMQMAERGSFSPDGKQIAYTPFTEAFWSWKRYRGGRTVPIWVLDLSTHEHIEITHENASDTFPCWVGEGIYFLSDRCGVMNVFRYDLKTCLVTQVTFHADFDVRSLTAGAGWLTYEQGGRIHLLNPADGQAVPLKITVPADLPETRPHYVPAAAYIQNAGISPTGSRAVFEARGEIFTLPAKKGDARNLTQTTGVCERDPSWSPDGKSIAYFSDASGEYELVISDQKGVKKTFIPLGRRSFFYSPAWSPDGNKIAFTDKALNLYYINLKPSGVPVPEGDQPTPPSQAPQPVEQPKEIVLVDTDTYDHPERSLNPAWSPDSQWLAYTKRLNSHIRAVFLYELASRQAHQVTDGMSDATDACWSQDGKYLFFAASSNYGLNTGWLDMSSMERPVNRSLYVMVLSKDESSPLAPESDEEKGPESEKKEDETKSEDKPEASKTEETKTEEGKSKEDEDKPPVPTVKIDLEKLDQRIQALPMPARDYQRLRAIEGKLFYMELSPHQLPEDEVYAYDLSAYDLKERKDEIFITNVRRYWVSVDGKKLLFQTADRHPRYAIVATDKKPEIKEEDFLNIQFMEIPVDPKAEWRQIFREAYRIHRDYFYDAPLHGLDWEATCQKYLPFLEHVGHREDLNYLLAELSGELVVGHAYVGFGDVPSPDKVSVGLLGVDFEVVDGFYRIQRIYSGLNWHPELRSPLTEPGVNIAEGEYLLGVNGRPLRFPTSPYSLFEKTAGQVTDLLVSPTPDEAGGRPESGLSGGRPESGLSGGRPESGLSGGRPESGLSGGRPESGLSGARTVTVKPIGSETALRHWNWVEGNRKKVDALSDGRVAYIYMPDTSVDGYASFNRYYYSQLDKQAVVLDERFNGGGYVADYVVDMLDRPLLSYWATREGKEFTTPNASIFGPKVMIINELAGSGGDAMPHFFRRRGLGKLVGKRTWGGLIGLYDYPVLMDGGFFTSPRLAIYSPEGEWEVENEGVTPDIEVEQTPKLVIAGHDPQLEKAVEVVLAELEAHPPVRKGRPKPAMRA